MKSNFRFKVKPTPEAPPFMLGDVLITKELHDQIVSQPVTTGSLTVENIKALFGQKFKMCSVCYCEERETCNCSCHKYETV